MPNKIEQAITRMRESIQARLKAGLTTQEKIDASSKALDMEIMEYCKFQELKSCAFIEQILTLEEAELIYRYLGNIPEQFNRQPIEVKFVLTQLFGELLQRRIAIQKKG